jgi:hypothetical protein
MAAVLACGEGAVLSHHSAARHLELVRVARWRTDVTVPRRNGLAQPAIAVHRVARLDPDDWALCEGIPTTTVARTLLDLASTVSASELTRAIEAAERRRSFDLVAIQRLLARRPCVPGTRLLRSVLGDAVIEPASRSELESIFHDIVGQAGLPRPQANVLVEGFEVDAFWPDLKLIVEIDSFAYHRSRAAFERDRMRDVQLRLAGYTVLRFTDTQLTTDPNAVIAALRRVCHGPAS